MLFPFIKIDFLGLFFYHWTLPPGSKKLLTRLVISLNSVSDSTKKQIIITIQLYHTLPIDWMIMDNLFYFI